VIHRSTLRGITALALLAAHPSLATEVTVSAKTASGTPATDTLVIFDPATPAPPSGHPAAIIDQVNKRFVPHLSIVRTGTAVTFPNSDNIRHQVYSFSEAKKFTLKLYSGAARQQLIFDKPGLVALGCNIHDTMIGFLAVVDSPYFGKVSDQGALSLDMPPGHYRLRVWNPALAAAVPPREIEIGSSPLTLPITMTLEPGRETIADWPE
jgi:plastocyanin